MPTLAETIAVPWTAQQYQALTAAIVNDEWGEHDLCSLTACRLPLHPGPCKGWKHTLHLTAPGVYHTLERERVAKANARRTAKIAQLQAQGKHVPVALRRPITYSPPAASTTAKMGQHAEVVGGTSHTAAKAANAAAGVTQKTAPNPHPQGTATAGTDSVAQAAKSQTVAQAAQAATPGKVTHGVAVKPAPAITPAPALGPAVLHNPPAVPGTLRGPDQAHIANMLADPATSDLTKATILAGLTPTEFNANFDAAHRQLVIDKLDELSRHADPATAKRASVGLAKVGAYKGAPRPTPQPTAHVTPAPPAHSPSAPSPPAPHVAHTPRQAKALGDIAAHPRDVTGNLHSIKLLGVQGYLDLSPADRQKVRDYVHTQSTSHVPTAAQRAQAKRLDASLAKIDAGTTPVATHAPGTGPATPAAPSAPAAVAPAAPLPATSSAAAKLAHATANRTAAKSVLSKTQVDNYDKLTKADFDQLPDATRAQIRSDLRVAKQKFLDPKKQAHADSLLTRFGTGGHIAPVVTAPSAPAPLTPAVAAKVNVAIPSLSWSGDRRLAAYEKMTKADFDSLPDAMRARTLRDLDMLSKHGSPLDAHGQQRANAAHVVLRGAPPTRTAPYVPPAVIQAPTPAVGNHNAAAIHQALQTAGTSSLLTTLENASRDDITGHLSTYDRKILDRKLAMLSTDVNTAPADQARAKELRNAINSPIPAGTSEKDNLADLAAAHNKGAIKGKISAAQAVAGKGYTSHTADLAQHAHVADNVDFLDTLDRTNGKQLRELDTPDFVSVTQRLDDIATNGKPDERDAAKALQDALQATGHPTTKQFGDIADEIEAARNAPAAPAAVHPIAQTIRDAVARFHKDGSGENLMRVITREKASPDVAVAGSPGRVALYDELDSMVSDTTLPAWVRSDILTSSQSSLPSYMARPYNSANWDTAVSVSQHPASRLWSTYDVGDLFAPNQAKLAQMEPVHAQSVREAREAALASVVTRNLGNYGVVKSDLNAILRTGGTPIPGSGLSAQGKENYDSLSPAGQKHIITMLEATQGGYGTFTEKARFQRIHDELTGKKYNAAQSAAIDEASRGTRSVDAATLATLSDLTSSEYQGLPQVYRDAIDDHLDLINGGLIARGAVPPNVDSPLVVKARLRGELPQYSSNEQIQAVLSATIAKDWLTPDQQLVALRRLDVYGYTDLKVADQVAVMRQANLLGGTGSPLTNDADRHNLEIRRLSWDGTWGGYSVAQRDTAVVTGPGAYQFPDGTVKDRLDDLDKAGYDGLTPSLRQFVDQRIARLPAVDAVAYQAKFHPTAPAYTARSAPSVGYGTTISSDVKVNAALDIIYGRHAKADHVADQIRAYGALRKDQFDSLNAAEQSQLLGDLSYIATTSKGSNAVKAKAFIDRFTPAGTPLGGNAPAPAPSVPVVAVAGQTRLPTPTAGLLKQTSDKGIAGDAWVTVPGGKRVWGTYGAAGLLLAHDGPDGKRRYLMVQRGPAISDPGKWQFPGGAIDSKESAYQGGTREVIEELGFKPDALDTAVVHGYHESTIPGATWKYTSIVATVPDQLTPDLSTHHARAETSDAKWMTIDEIRALDTGGKLLAPLAGGKLEQNVVSLLPAKGAGTLSQAARPAPRTSRLKRLVPPRPTAHKPSRGVDLVSDKTARDKLRQDVKKTRAQFAGKTADDRLAAIGAIQGHDDTPTVLSKAEIDKLLKTGDYVEAWRGVRGTYGGKSARQINEEMRTGPAYYGKGIFGNGYYISTQRGVAKGYSDYTDGSMVRILIPKSAITERHDKVLREATAASSSRSKSKGGGYEDGTLWDEGRYAAGKGLDGIEIPTGMRGRAVGAQSGHIARPGLPSYNWLNRSVLILQAEPG